MSLKGLNRKDSEDPGTCRGSNQWRQLNNITFSTFLRY